MNFIVFFELRYKLLWWCVKDAKYSWSFDSFPMSPFNPSRNSKKNVCQQKHIVAHFNAEFLSESPGGAGIFGFRKKDLRCGRERRA